MQVLVEKYDIQKAVSLCLSVIEKKATMPILSNILISAKNDKLTFSASDLEVTAITTIPAKVNKQGETTISSRIFGDLVRELSENKVELELKENERLEIRSGKASWKIIGVSAEEYPTLPGIGINSTSRVSATMFLDMINKTIYATSEDETAFNLTGVYFCNYTKDQKTSFRMVGTDGNRISIISKELKEIKIDEGVIVPKKGLSEIRKFLSDLEDADIGIGICDGFLVIDTQNTKLSMRLIDGDFPRFEQVLPSSKESLAKVNTKEFYRAIRRVSILATDKTKGVKLNFGENFLRVYSSSQELGEGHEEFSIEYLGEPLEVAFNGSYLQDFATSVGEASEIIIELNGEVSPAKFYTESDPDYFSIIMPMRMP